MTFTDPLALFRAAIAAYARGDYLAVAHYCDPASVRAFRRQLLWQYAPAEPRRELTVEQLLRMSPAMPREVAEYEVMERREAADPARRIQRDLPGIGSLDALRSLDPTELFAEWLRAHSVRGRTEQLRRSERVAPETLAWAEELQRHAVRLVALAVVHDGSRVAYVVYRSQVDAPATDADDFTNHLATLPEDEQALERDLWASDTPSLLRCRRQPDGTWLLLAEHGFLEHGSLVLAVGPEGDEDPTTTATLE